VCRRQALQALPEEKLEIVIILMLRTCPSQCRGRSWHDRCVSLLLDAIQPFAFVAPGTHAIGEQQLYVTREIPSGTALPQ